MRLNWFVPHAQGKLGSGRRLLKRLGRSWLASPLRRIVQVLSLAVFLSLFLFVCWPYTAQRTRAWSGWMPVEVDQATGNVTVAAEQDSGNRPAVGTTVFPVDNTVPDEQGLGRFRVARVGENELLLEPEDALSPEQMDRLAMSFSPWLLLESEPGDWPSHYADDLVSKEFLPSESFLAIDPLASLSIALASRTWIATLSCATVLLLVCLLIPRGFCGYLCPLGTLIDIFDWLVGKRVSRFRLPAQGWWVHVKYYLLLATLVCAASGVVVSGFVAAIPVLTRGFVFLVKPLQTAGERGWHQVPAMTSGQWVSVALFAGVFLLSLLGRRFWCRCVCPTGAIFSVANLLRITERRVTSSCAGCGKCVETCSFDAIHDDFTTRTAECTFCQTCGGVCSVGAIQFGPRGDDRDLRPTSDPAGEAAAVPRRGFLATAIGLMAGTAGGITAAVAIPAAKPHPADSDGKPPVRPPGSVPEEQFLRMCVRCGQCLQACPNDVLQASAFDQGLEGLWTPQVVADWSGCEPSCNNCGQVCPTGAIRPLPLEEKRVARMGLAVVDEQTCLPFAGQGECQLCVDECVTAGYRAIEFIRVGTELNADGQPLADSGFLAPVVLADRCVGCGLCQTRCYGMNVADKGLLTRSAIIVEAGNGNEDRLRRGSYKTLRENEQRARQRKQRRSRKHEASDSSYLPDFLK